MLDYNTILPKQSAPQEKSKPLSFLSHTVMHSLFNFLYLLFHFCNSFPRQHLGLLSADKGCSAQCHRAGARALSQHLKLSAHKGFIFPYFSVWQLHSEPVHFLCQHSYQSLLMHQKKTSCPSLCLFPLSVFGFMLGLCFCREVVFFFSMCTSNYLILISISHPFTKNCKNLVTWLLHLGHPFISRMPLNSSNSKTASSGSSFRHRLPADNHSPDGRIHTQVHSF